MPKGRHKRIDALPIPEESGERCERCGKVGRLFGRWLCRACYLEAYREGSLPVIWGRVRGALC